MAQFISGQVEQSPQEKFKNFLNSLTSKRTLGLLATLFLILALPVTVYFSMQKQVFKQYASEKTNNVFTTVYNYVWVTSSSIGSFDNVISIFSMDTSPIRTVTDGAELQQYGATHIALIKKQVWVSVLGLDRTISVFGTDGTFIKTITGNGIDQPRQILRVGDQVWVLNFGVGTISVFGTDGSPIKIIEGKGLGMGGGSNFMLLVRNHVWVGNAINQKSGTISVFGTDGSPIKIIKGNGLSNINDAVVVGSQVWVVNSGVPVSPPIPGTISVFGTDGSPIKIIKGNGLEVTRCIALVGNQVWVGNDLGFTGKGDISVFGTDGSPIKIIKGNGISTSRKIKLINNQVWQFDLSTIHLFKQDGTFIKTITGNGLRYSLMDAAIIPGPDSFPSPTNTPTPTPAPINWVTPDVSLEASNFYVKIGNKYESSANAQVKTYDIGKDGLLFQAILPQGSYNEIFNLYFSYDPGSSIWKVDKVEASNRYAFDFPPITSVLGVPYTANSLDIMSTDGHVLIHFDNLNLQAFKDLITPTPTP